MKNNKGFTLVELIGAIIILSIVLIITFVTVMSAFNSYKEKSEKSFVGMVGNVIEEYITLNTSNLTFTDISNSYIVKESFGDSKYCTDYVAKTERLSFSLLEELFDKELVNPNGKVKCTVSGTTSYFTIYRDSDFVYYYEADLDCVETNDESNNNIVDITTVPKFESVCSY